MTHQHRDTLASIVGHSTLNSYLAISDGEAIGRVKFEMCEVCTRDVPFSAVRLSRILNAECEADVATLRTSTTEGRVEYLDNASGVLNRSSAIDHIVAGNLRGSGTFVGPSKYTHSFQDYRGH